MRGSKVKSHNTAHTKPLEVLFHPAADANVQEIPCSMSRDDDSPELPHSSPFGHGISRVWAWVLVVGSVVFATAWLLILAYNIEKLIANGLF
jgi:hypothetical protein